MKFKRAHDAYQCASDPRLRIASRVARFTRYLVWGVYVKGRRVSTGRWLWQARKFARAHWQPDFMPDLAAFGYPKEHRATAAHNLVWV